MAVWHPRPVLVDLPCWLSARAAWAGAGSRWQWRSHWQLPCGRAVAAAVKAKGQTTQARRGTAGASAGGGVGLQDGTPGAVFWGFPKIKIQPPCGVTVPLAIG